MKNSTWKYSHLSTGLSCQVILPILFKYIDPNYIRLSLYLFVNSAITTLPQFSPLNLCTSLFFPLFFPYGFFLFFFYFVWFPIARLFLMIFLCGFPLVLEDCKEHNPGSLILLLFPFVPFSLLQKIGTKFSIVLWFIVLSCTMLIKQRLEI